MDAPARSDGVLLSAFADGAVAYDLGTETLHHLNATAGQVLASCDGRSDLDAEIANWAAAAGVDAAIVRRDVETVIADFRQLGLIDRHGTSTPQQTFVGSSSAAFPGDVNGVGHAVLDRFVRFRSTRADLVEAVDAHLGAGRAERQIPATLGHEGDAEPGAVIFDLVALPDGEIELVGDTVWRFASMASLLDQLTSVVNEIAVTTDGCVALHAGAVRSPGGRLVLIPGHSGAGKSTMTAALVAAGWDYLGDEAIGLDLASGAAIAYPKRLAIGRTSRAALGIPDSPFRDLSADDLRSGALRLEGTVGPVDHIVFPTFTADQPATFTACSTTEAFDALLANTLNLARVGTPGLDTLCRLAERTSAARLFHNDALSIADVLTNDLDPQPAASHAIAPSTLPDSA